MKPPAARDAGPRVEAAARDWLEARGLQTVATNFRSRRGELDLVMREGTELVIVEVRYRAGRSHGGAAASVDARKQRRLLATAGWLLATRPALGRLRMRFDVLAASGEPEAPDFEWLRDAFRA
ncbi:MAG: YraN family protein [Steroidobacteraceae bacterium]|jgi:putative endonuclease|nr:YraN family protein [Steroidobacteraceae bacterium]